MKAFILVVVVLLVLWMLFGGSTLDSLPGSDTAVPGGPEVKPPNSPEDAVGKTDNFLKGLPPWVLTQVVPLIIIIALAGALKNKNPALFWALIGIGIGALALAIFI